LYGLCFLNCFKHWRSNFVFHTQRHRNGPCLSQVFAQRAKKLNMILGHFGAFWQLLLHVIGNVQNLLELIAVRAVEGEELKDLRLSGYRFVEGNILLAIAELCSRCAKSQNHTCQRQPYFFHDQISPGCVRLIHWR